MATVNCFNCNKDFEGRRRRKYCSKKCSSIKNAVNFSPEHRAKISKGVKEYRRNNPLSQKTRKEISKLIGGITKTDKVPLNIFDMSKRTTTKILHRLNLNCSLCGWNKASCDVHHINGKKIKDANNHKNLTYVCPNCHREIHFGLVKKEELITLDEYIPENWHESYYG